MTGRTLTGRAAPDARLAGGAVAHVAIRPEDIVVDPGDPATLDGGALDGTIEALLFVGDRYEARVSLGGEQRIHLLLSRSRDWREGQRLRLGFPRDVVSVWPA
jgi:TOBE domain